MEASELAALLNEAESDRLAFLRERARLDEVAETLVAFANRSGGTLIFGVSGRGRAKVEGVREPVAVRELVLEGALACAPPLIMPLPEVVQHNELTLLIATVPAGLPQVYALHGKYLRREGGTNQPLTPDALRRLLIDRGDVAWDRSPALTGTLADLDPQKIAAYAARVDPDAINEPLALVQRRGCVVQGSGVRSQESGGVGQEAETGGQGDEGAGAQRGERPTTNDHSRMGVILHPSSFAVRPSSLGPTNAGLLLFARTIEAHFPQAELTLVHYRGRDMADAFEREDIHDTLPEAIRRAERWLVAHMRKGSRMIDLEREDWAQFPHGAVREAIVNAVAHRDYSVRGEGVRVSLFSDRLEVYSPGRLPGHVTVENIVAERFSRNETLVQVLADLGLIERLGYGIDRMLRQMEDAGLPPPAFRETAAGFLVVLQGQGADDLPPDSVDLREWAKLGLNERQIAALVHVTEERRITNRELQERYPAVSGETIRRDLADLVERGMLLKVGDKRATYYILK
jgi:ATP-dependent DNA helicase RecG